MIKKNLLKSITAFFIVAILAFSIVGCNKTDNSGSDSVNVSDSGGAEPTVENENHRFSYKETNEYLIKNGTTEYKIVIPSENVSAELNIARDELVRLFKEATGVTLEAISDAGKSHDANGKNFFKPSGTNRMKMARTVKKAVDSLSHSCYIGAIKESTEVIVCALPLWTMMPASAVCCIPG